MIPTGTAEETLAHLPELWLDEKFWTGVVLRRPLHRQLKVDEAYGPIDGRIL